MKKKILIFISFIFIIALIGIIFIAINLPKEKNIIDFIEETKINFQENFIEETVPTETIENNKNFYTFLDTIENIEKLSSSKINTQIKFISVEENTYKDLLTLSLTGNVENKNEKYTYDGILNLNMNNINVNMKFPTYMKNLGTEEYSIILEVPSNYKKAFSMLESENYLKIDKNSKEKLDELFGIKEEIVLTEETTPTKIQENSKTFNSTLVFTPNVDDETTGIYDIEFNQNALKALHKQINENEEYSTNILISTFLKNILKDEKNIENMTKMKGQIAVSKGVATDIYFEIESKTTSMIAFRITLTEINNSKITEKEYHSNKIKDFDTFIESLIEAEESNKYANRTMNIGNIYFTGKDDTQKIENFTTEMLSDPINVFINYSKCNPKTNIIIKWFYENQSIQIIENKLNNGDYEDGILKSSITFSDIENVPKGKYRVEIYIEGQDKCYGQKEFTLE